MPGVATIDCHVAGGKLLGRANMMLSTPRLAGLAARRLCTQSFAGLEHSMWQRGATAYESSFARVTGQAAKPPA